jgi:alanyl-tRNA synthetase
MSSSSSSTTNPNDSNSNSTLTALFQEDNHDFAEEFRDKVGALHEHFDRDGDGYLNFHELGDLQYKTSGSELDQDQYVMVCKALSCHPTKGIPVEALRLTYASEGTNLDDDYFKVFPERQKKKKEAAQKEQDGGEKVYEVGPGGVDIS